jgi:hypothetical protein
LHHTEANKDELYHFHDPKPERLYWINHFLKHGMVFTVPPLLKRIVHEKESGVKVGIQYLYTYLLTYLTVFILYLLYDNDYDGFKVILC